MIKFSKWLLSGTGIAMAMTSHGAAFAQAAEADPSDIVVTARRVAERLQDVPIAITAYSGEQLAKKNITRISDVGAFAPGFTIQVGGSNATTIYIQQRGQVANEILATVEPSIGTYVDDLYWSRAYGLNSSMLDVSNVQVLKGPQGTLFGRNTIGGALIITPNDPKLGETGGMLRATYGRYNEAAADATINLPVTDRVAVRAAFHVRNRDGYSYGVRQYNVATGLPDNNFLPAGQGVIRPDGSKYDGVREIQGRLKTLFELSDATTVVLSGEWFNAHNEPSRRLIYKINFNDSTPAGDNLAGLTPVLAYQNYFRDHPNATGADVFNCNYAVTQVNCQDTIRPFDRLKDVTKTQTYVGKLISETAIGTAKIIGGYRKVKADTIFDLDGSPVVLHSTTLFQNLESYSAEAQLTGKVASSLDYAVGATYFAESGVDGSYSFSSRPGGTRRNNATRNYADIDNKSYGLYAQASYHFLEDLTFTGGIRYSHDKKGIEIRSANVNLAGVPEGLAPASVSPLLANPCNAAGNATPPTAAAPNMRFDYVTGATAANDCAATRSDSFHAFSWTAGLDYKITPAAMLYAKISRGYRAGGQNLRAFNDYQFVPFKPETLTEIEIGMKSDWLDRRVTLNVSAYRSILEDAQRSTQQITGTISNTIIANAAKVRNMGVEADLNVRPVQGLTLTAAGSYNELKYLSYSDARGDLRNTRVQFVPKYTFLLAAAYEMPLGDDKSLTFNVDYRQVGKMAGDLCTVTGAAACWSRGPSLDQTQLQISQSVFDATTLPSTQSLGARITLGLDDDKYQLSLWGKNLLNDRAFTGANPILVPYRNYVGGIRREPLTYGATVEAKF